MSERVFVAKAVYDPRNECWMAQVWVDSTWVRQPCWVGARTFEFGARFSARRMAAKLNRLEKRGAVV